MPELKFLIECLRDILPNKYTDNPDPVFCFRSCIERYLNRLDENSDLINLIQNLETSEAYVHCCLHFFNSLAGLDAPYDKTAPVFSVYQTQQIIQCFEFVVCLGIYPFLSPGVSMPLELRLDNFDKFKYPSSLNAENRVSILSQISNCFEGLLRSSIDTLNDLISPSKFLGDYLAVLFQLGFGPFPRDCLNSKPTLDIIRTSRMRLCNLLNRLPRSVAFKQLFLFQSGFKKKRSSEKKTRAPKWLSDACGRLITRLFVARPCSGCPSRQSALKDLIVGVIDIHATDPRHIPALACSLAHILATPPQMCALSDDYYNSLSLQITDALATCWTEKESKDLLLRITRLVAVDTIHAICERDLELGKRLFLCEVLSKLAKVVAADENDNYETSSAVIDISDSLELLSAKDLFFIVNFISELLDARHPSQALCTLLASYSHIWFHFCSLLNLASPNGAEKKDGEECQIKEASGLSPVDEFRSKLLSILSNHLLNPDTSFHLLRGWIHLPPLDQNTFKPSLSSELDSLLVPLSSSVVLRPASLVIPISSDTTTAAPHAPFRLTRAAEAMPQHSFELISARVATVMELLAPKVDDNVVEDGSEGADEVERAELKAEQLLGSWTEGMREEESTKLSCLAAKILLSLISDINSAVIVDVNEDRSNVRVVSQPTNFDMDKAQQDLSVPLTACLLATAMLERFDPSNLWPSDPALAVHLISLTLSRLCVVIDTVTRKEVLKMAEESLNLVLGIAAFFVNFMEKGDKVSSNVRNQFGELVPLMERVEAIFPQTSASAELAQQIRISLCTRGVFSVPTPPTSCVSNSEFVPKKCLIEEVCSPTPDKQPAAALKLDSEMSSQLTEVFRQLDDSFIPVQGHALIELSRLLESKDPCVIGWEDKIYETLVKFMNHEDSYIYLNAIRGLSAIGNAFTDRLLPLLLGRFLEKTGNSEFRLKVGEALVRVLRELGEIAPKYRDAVVGGLIIASKDDSDFIRAASLSNLAEICQLLGRSIQPVIYEVYNVMEYSMKHDSSALVRKSAAYLARGLFLTGACISRRDQLARLPGEIVRDTHRLLKDRLLIERDETVLEQLEAAMFEVDACAREAAFRPANTRADLVKEIRVLRPFD